MSAETAVEAHVTEILIWNSFKSLVFFWPRLVAGRSGCGQYALFWRVAVHASCEFYFGLLALYRIPNYYSVSGTARSEVLYCVWDTPTLPSKERLSDQQLENGALSRLIHSATTGLSLRCANSILRLTLL